MYEKCSRSHSDRIQSSEAQILQKLNELQLEFQEGKRAAPAFSLVTVETLDKEETWHNIIKELQTKDLDTRSISTNQGYIRGWIDQVLLVDEDADTGKYFRMNIHHLKPSVKVLLNHLDVSYDALTGRQRPTWRKHRISRELSQEACFILLKAD